MVLRSNSPERRLAFQKKLRIEAKDQAVIGVLNNRWTETENIEDFVNDYGRVMDMVGRRMVIDITKNPPFRRV